MTGLVPCMDKRTSFLFCCAVLCLYLGACTCSWLACRGLVFEAQLHNANHSRPVEIYRRFPVLLSPLALRGAGAEEKGAGDHGEHSEADSKGKEIIYVAPKKKLLRCVFGTVIL